jgi:hypothetical protein
MSGPVLSFPPYTRIKSRSSAAHVVSQPECVLYGGLLLRFVLRGPVARYTVLSQS